LEKATLLRKGNLAELDTSEHLNAKGILSYQSIIGTSRWAVFGVLEIVPAAMNLSSFDQHQVKIIRQEPSAYALFSTE